MVYLLYFYLFFLFCLFFFFFFNDTATTEIYTLSLHDALPISFGLSIGCSRTRSTTSRHRAKRSEEHTSELQLRQYLVCRLLLEKKKKNKKKNSNKKKNKKKEQKHKKNNKT